MKLQSIALMSMGALIGSLAGLSGGYYGKQYLDELGTRDCVYNKTLTTTATRQNGDQTDNNNYAKQEVQVFSASGRCDYKFDFEDEK